MKVLKLEVREVPSETKLTKANVRRRKEGFKQGTTTIMVNTLRKEDRKKLSNRNPLSRIVKRFINI